MDVIFIELENPIRYFVAIRVRESKYYHAYILEELRDDGLRDIEESKELERVEKSNLPDFDGVYEWKNRYEKDFCRAWTHKTVN